VAAASIGETMALKMLVKTPAPVIEEPVVIPKVVETPQSEVEALTAEYIALYEKFEYFEVKTLVKRMDDIRKQLVAIANETLEDKKPALFVCPQGEVEFSERGTKAVAQNPLALIQVLLEKFGAEVTTEVVDIGITPLRKLLSEFELKEHLTDVPGVRTLKSVRPA
jgi:hypothetical protein